MTGVGRKLKRGVTSFITDTLGYNVLPGGPIFGRRIEKQKRLGYNRRHDWKRLMAQEPAPTIFDVGANVGQSALEFAALFPGSRVFSFEPDPVVFQELKRNTDDNSRILTVNAAVGAESGRANLFVNELRVTNSLLDTSSEAGRFVEADWLKHKEVVSVDLITLDSFCVEKKIETIHLLKIDAQGYELRILEGARRLIGDKSIPLIYLEVNFVPLYKDQPLFHQIYEYFRGYDYKLAGLYGAVSNQNYLVSSDALFVLDLA